MRRSGLRHLGFNADVKQNGKHINRATSKKRYLLLNTGMGLKGKHRDVIRTKDSEPLITFRDLLSAFVQLMLSIFGGTTSMLTYHALCP